MPKSPPREKSHFEKVSDALSNSRLSDIRTLQKQAFDFFVKKTGGDRSAFEQLQFGKREVSDIQPGQMFTYVYDAKYGESLPYWDQQPLVIFLGVQENGNFLGLNLHYIPPMVRVKILAQLLKVVGAKTLRHDTKLRLTYAMVRSIATFKPLGFCIKSYIPERIHRIVRIQPIEWGHAVVLPSEAFVKKSKSFVWRQSGVYG